MDYVLHSVATSSRGEKFNSMIDGLKEPSYVFDFQYHEKATLWIDHHQNPKIGIDPVFNEKICYDGRAASAAMLVVKHLQSELNLAIDENTMRVVNSVNMIDSADYPSIDFAFKDISPIMAMRAFFETSFPSEMLFCRFVEVLVSCGLDIEKANKVLGINKTYVEQLEKDANKIKDKLEVYSNISVIRQKFAYQYPRYAEYYVANPTYSLRISNENSSDFRVNISFNKWSGKKNSINIGSYCMGSKFIKKGGGHYNVGGGLVDKNKLDEFLDAFSIVVEGE